MRRPSAAIALACMGLGGDLMEYDGVLQSIKGNKASIAPYLNHKIEPLAAHSRYRLMQPWIATLHGVALASRSIPPALRYAITTAIVLGVV